MAKNYIEGPSNPTADELFGKTSTSDKLWGTGSLSDKLFGPGSTVSKLFPLPPQKSPGGSTMDNKMIQGIADVVKSKIPGDTQSKKLDNAPTRGGIPEVRAEGKTQGTTRKGSGGALSSPFTEGETAHVPQDPVLDRTYYTAQVATSSDGIFTFEFQQLHQVKMIDAGGNVVTFIFAQET